MGNANTLRLAANVGGFLLILAAAVAAAARVPYAIAFVLAAAGIASILGVRILLREGAAKALTTLAESAGAPTTSHQEEDGSPWLQGLGFFDLSRQPIRRLRRQTVEIDGGSVHLVEFFIGAGKPAVMNAAIFSASCRVPGALCLRPKGMGESLRAKSIGGSVTTGTPLDASAVIYAPDAATASAAASALDEKERLELLRFATSLGAGKDVAFAIANGRASFLVENPSAGLFSTTGGREILQRLSRCARR